LGPIFGRAGDKEVAKACSRAMYIIKEQTEEYLQLVGTEVA
jgi:hypothetical protein